MKTDEAKSESQSGRRLTGEPYVISSPVSVQIGQPIQIQRSARGPAAAASASTMSGDNDSAAPPRLETIADFKAPDVDSLIIFYPSAHSERTRWQSLSFPDDASAFPEGSIRILNLSDATMIGAFGSERVQLAAGQARIIHPKLDSRNRARTRIAVREKNSGAPGDWELIFNSITTVGDGQRVTGVLVYSPSGLSYSEQQLAAYGPLPPGYFWLTSKDTVQ